MGFPVILDLLAELVELLDALRVGAKGALGAGRSKLQESEDKHERHCGGAEAGHPAVAGCFLDFGVAQSSEIVEEDAARKRQDYEGFGEESRGEFAAQQKG